MRAKQISNSDLLHPEKPETNISHSPYIENYKNNNSKKHNNSIVDSNKVENCNCY
jgi:hypothetical protein